MIPTPELVLLEIRHAVAYQRARFPNTYPEIGEAAAKLVQSKTFADFVDDCLAPESAGTKPAKTSPTEGTDTSPRCENNLPDCGPGDLLTSDDVHLCERCYRGLVRELCDHPSADGTGVPGEWNLMAALKASLAAAGPKK